MKRLFALLTALLLLTGCSQLEIPPEDEDILFPLEEQADTTEATALPEVFSLPYLSTQPLNPLACPDGMQQTVASLLYEGLFHLDTALAPQPVLCASYTYDAEALTYTLTLRPNAVFSDGSPLTAADVKTTLTAAKASPRYSERLTDLKSVSGSGSTLTLTLNRANSALPALLDIPIVKAGTETSLTPIGTGPYQFTSGESSSRLTANPNWWNGGALPVQQIFLSAAEDRDTLLYPPMTSSCSLQISPVRIPSLPPATPAFRMWTPRFCSMLESTSTVPPLTTLPCARR